MSIRSATATVAIRPEGPASTISRHSAGSTHRPCLGESPFVIEDFGARPKQAHHVVPALHDREAIRNFAVAAAELDGERAIRAPFSGDIVYGIGVVWVRFQIALCVVDGD